MFDGSARRIIIAAARKWIVEGRVRYHEDMVDGVKNAPRAFLGMLSGSNFGKVIVRAA